MDEREVVVIGSAGGVLAVALRMAVPRVIFYIVAMGLAFLILGDQFVFATAIGMVVASVFVDFVYATARIALEIETISREE